MKISKESIKNVFFAAAAISFGVLIIIYSKAVAASVLTALERCLTVIIPSLYIFTALSGFFINSGTYQLLGKFFGTFSRCILKIPEELFGIFLISSVAGYPIGAKLISELYDRSEINKKDAERLLCVCYSSGPAFVIGTVGYSMFAESINVKAGLALFLSNFAANLLLLALINIGKPVPKKTDKKTKLDFSADTIVNSVVSGGKSMLVICAVIVSFASLTAVLSLTGVSSKLALALSSVFGISEPLSETLLCAFMEISCITGLDSGTLYPIAAAMLSFGGLCVLLQIKAIMGNRFSLKKFMLARPICAGFSYIFSKIIFFLMNIDISSTASVNICANNINYSPVLSVILLIMTILLLSEKSIAKN